MRQEISRLIKIIMTASAVKNQMFFDQIHAEISVYEMHKNGYKKLA